MQNWPGVLTGGCLCGDIRYELKGPALFVGQCCCKDCQKATGTGHTTIIGVMRPQLSLRASIAGRGDWIRTSDHLHPMQVRYRAALHPDLPCPVFADRSWNAPPPGTVHPFRAANVIESSKCRSPGSGYDHFGPGMAVANRWARQHPCLLPLWRTCSPRPSPCAGPLRCCSLSYRSDPVRTTALRRVGQRTRGRKRPH